MNELPKEILKRWWHSFEEEAGDITVYRPTEFNFPRARGRAGIEFASDGSFIDWVIGPADAPRAVKGHWRIEAPGRVRIWFEEGIHRPRVLDIVQCDTEILKVRQRPASS